MLGHLLEWGGVTAVYVPICAALLRLMWVARDPMSYSEHQLRVPQLAPAEVPNLYGNPMGHV